MKHTVKQQDFLMVPQTVLHYQTAVDANISKEKLNTTEFGLNLGFFNGRVSLDASYFTTITS
jgi:hypothetical protein